MADPQNQPTTPSAATPAPSTAPAAKPSGKKTVTVLVPPREGFSGFRAGGRHYQTGATRVDLTDEEIANLKGRPGHFISVLDDSADVNSKEADLDQSEKEALEMVRQAIKRDPKGVAGWIQGNGAALATLGSVATDMAPPSGKPTNSIEMGMPDVSRPSKRADAIEQAAAEADAEGEEPPRTSTPPGGQKPVPKK